MKKEITTIGIILAALSFCFFGCKENTTPPHQCNWKGCEYNDLTSLPKAYNPIDSIHFYNPGLSYDVCEAQAMKLENAAQPYYNGEILYPDYVHDDTLIVTDAAAMNYLISRDTLNTDGSNSDILCVGSEPFNR